MGWFGVGKEIAEPVNAIGDALDKLFTSDEERANAQFVIEKLRMEPALAQAALNMQALKNKSFYHAGWRAAIGWVCAYSIFYHMILAPLLFQIFKLPMPPMGIDEVLSIVVPMLGLGAYRTVEKVKGVANG